MRKASGKSKGVLFSPRTANDLVDLLARERGKQLGKAIDKQALPLNLDVVKVKNTSGTNLLRGACLNVSGSLFGTEPYDAEHLWFEGIEPTGTQQFGILRRATPDDDIDELQVSGVCIAQVVVSDASHNFAVPVAASTVFASAETGPLLLLHKPTATGTMECVVVFRGSGGDKPIRFELLGDLSLGGEAGAKQLAWNGSAYVKIGNQFTVRDYTAKSWKGKTGYWGWCLLETDRNDVTDEDEYEIIWMETQARWVEFTLAANISSGSALATINTDTTSTYWHINGPPLNGSSQITVYDREGLFTRALSGAKGIAVYDERRDKYIIEECQSKAGWIRFTLTADMADSESAAATVTDYGGTQDDVQSPGSTVTVYDTSDLFKFAKSGAKGIAIYDAIDDKYRVVECQSKAGQIDFALTSDITGGSASATVTRYYGTQQDVQDPSSVTVYDDDGVFPFALSGAVGTAIFDSDNDKYRIVKCQQRTMHISGTLDSALATTDASFTESTYAVMDISPFNQAPTGELTIYNPFDMEGDAGAYFYARWHAGNAQWELYQVICPA